MNYGFDEKKNKKEMLTKEQVYALIADAIEQGTLPSVDNLEAFVTALKDPYTGLVHRVAFMTQAKYNELKAQGALLAGTYHFITDDDTAQDLENHMDGIDDDVESAQNDSNYLLGIITTDSVTFQSVYPSEDVEEDFDMEHFVRWAYPRASQAMQDKNVRQRLDGACVTMYDSDTNVAIFKGWFIWPDSMLVAVDYRGLSPFGSGLEWHLLSNIAVANDSATFDDDKMATYEQVNGKSDKPANKGTASSDGSYASGINESGLYALRVKTSENSNMVLTLMISIVQSSDCTSTISYLTNAGDRIYAEYTASSHRITAYYHNGTTYANAYIVGLPKLVAKY